MSSCVFDLYDYDLFKKCRVCGKFLLKVLISFKIERKKMETDLILQIVVRNDIVIIEIDYWTIWKFLTNKKRKNKYLWKENRRNHFNVNLAQNIRARTRQAYNSQNVNKLKKTFDLIGRSHSFSKSSNLHRIYNNMTLEKHGSLLANRSLSANRTFQFFRWKWDEQESQLG